MTSSQVTEPIGAVKTVWRYAVKSMHGEDIDEALISNGGILGDRAYAVVDQSNGKVASAKLPRKWGSLLELRASFVGSPDIGVPLPPVRITWPNGAEIISNKESPDELLSKTVGRSVSLTTIRPESVSVDRLDPLDPDESILDIGDLMVKGKFSDYADVHLLTTATLEHLAKLCPEVRFDERRFRPNLIVETNADQSGFVENDWVGQTIAIGNEVRLRVTDPTPRCAIPTLSNGEFPKDSKVLKTIVEHNRLEVPLFDGRVLPCAGVYAFVIQGGVVRRGDRVRIE